MYYGTSYRDSSRQSDDSSRSQRLTGRCNRIVAVVFKVDWVEVDDSLIMPHTGHVGNPLPHFY